LDSTRARLPRLEVFPLADSSARDVLRPRLVEAWRARLAANPSDDEALDALGYLLMESGRTAEAVDAYRSLVTLRPGDEDAKANLAEALRRAGPAASPAARHARP
jgi:cytochrome c-type biogenesis protein CcmH/NrfG